MKLNTIKPGHGAKRTGKRLGRGPGSGLGKTCGKGHKGQKARAGGYHKVGFEGGQMPLQRRLPKTGFRSRLALVTQEIRLSELNKVAGDAVTMQSLREAGLITSNIKRVKIVLSGELKGVKNVSGIKLTAGAKDAILAAGGKVEA
ncbi:MAG: 50S ribosomal protein L15 [Gammaproteobacteria bacterium 39-13]|nr:50S ribosomal protein L15 [Gammaproteobacteria bacterium]OJV92079.1 MAG: 50S ribosomal protein L15 [Gammaproteobacteria bacterium 39-13]